MSSSSIEIELAQKKPAALHGCCSKKRSREKGEEPGVDWSCFLGAIVYFSARFVEREGEGSVLVRRRSSLHQKKGGKRERKKSVGLSLEEEGGGGERFVC